MAQAVTPGDLAARIRARMVEQPDLIAMSDQQIERIAGVLSPVPSARRVRLVETGASL